MAHRSLEDLKTELAAAQTKVAVGARYAHYKHPEVHYWVAGLAILEASDEVAVRYSPVADPSVEFVRSLVSWLETVVVRGRQVPRFTEVH